MKFKKALLCFLILVFLSVSGCKPIYSNTDIKTSEQPSNITNTVEFSLDDIENSNTKIAIYDIPRDTFYKFIENPSEEFFCIDDCNIYEYIEGEPFFATNGPLILHMDTDFVKFVNDKSLMKDFLSKNNISGEIEQVITFWPPKVPLTIWVKINNENVFLTIKEDFSELSLDFQYSVINYNDYYEKFSPKNAILNVNGNTIETANNPIIYGDYCEIPFLGTLQALGATCKRKTDNDLIIIYDNIYCLDIENRNIYRWPLPYDNLLSGISGTHFFYTVDKDIMISDALFKYVLEGMQKNVLIDVDKDNGIIFIKTQT